MAAHPGPGHQVQGHPGQGHQGQQHPGPAHRLPQPQHVGVVGAGVVGLSVAWFLQERGLAVTVIDHRGAAGGASRGNAGLLTPAHAAPLPEPGVVRYGVRAVLDPSSPVYVPASADLGLVRFLAGFTRHCTARRWRAGMRALLPLVRGALDAFDSLAAGGVEVRAREAEPFLMCFADERERAAALDKFARVQDAGGEVDVEFLCGADARDLAPLLSERVGAALRLHRQRQVDTPEFVHALAEAVRSRGGEVTEGQAVTRVVAPGPAGVTVLTDAAPHRFDAVVLAAGVGVPALARPFGVRVPVAAGRGYSFSVTPAQLPDGPLQFPAQRVVATPMRDRLRLAGMMEFRPPKAPLDRRRIDAIAEAVRPLLRGVDLDERRDEWVGARPVTPDGLPLVGPTASPRVHVAGGHGMWGLLLGPVTGRLVAEAVATGVTPPELTPFDPLR